MTSRKSVEISGLILAAGPSSRLGHPKQLVRLKSGKTLLQKTVDDFRQSGLKHVVTVLGANHQDILDQHGGGLGDFVISPDWNLGMGNSLKFGVRQLLGVRSNLQGILIGVCDQPYLTSQHLKNLLSLFRENPNMIIASEYSGTSGVPVIFTESLFEDLLSLPDDQGAKAVLYDHSDLVLSLKLKGGELDIDTELDLKKINQDD